MNTYEVTTKSGKHQVQAETPETAEMLIWRQTGELGYDVTPRDEQNE